MKRKVSHLLLGIVRWFGDDTELAMIEEDLRIARKERAEWHNAVYQIHELLNGSDAPFYSWQRTYQQVCDLAYVDRD